MNAPAGPERRARAEPATPPRVNLLGVGVSAISMDQAVGTIASWIERREARYVCVTPAHSLMDAYRDEAFRRILNHSGMTTPDGMAVVWLLKLYGQRQVTRVYGPDLLLAVCRRSVESGWRHFFYGGEAGVAERLAATLEQRFPGLQVAGTYSPPFGALSPEEDARVVAQLNAARPDVIWVGLSSPKQERWMAEHRERLDAPVLVGVGAAFDFLSGRKPQAPRWMQRAGLEWLFRFSHEPRRLWPRYRQYPLFVWLALMQLTGIKKFPID